MANFVEEYEHAEAEMLAEVEATHGYLSFAAHSVTGDPGVADLFGQSVYVRGGLTLHALRSEAQCGQESTAVSDSAGCHDWNMENFNQLRH